MFSFAVKVALKYDIFLFFFFFVKPSEVSDLLSGLRERTGQGSGLASVGWWSLHRLSYTVTADQCLNPVSKSILMASSHLFQIYFQGGECLNFSLPEDPSPPGTPECFLPETLSSRPLLLHTQADFFEQRSSIL